MVVTRGQQDDVPAWAQEDESSQGSDEQEEEQEEEHFQDAQQKAGFVFALTPATASTGPIDYSQSEGRKLYSKGSDKLSDELFELTPDHLLGRNWTDTKWTDALGEWKV